MATVETIKSKIRSLIGKSNSTTGRTDTDLTAAVNALVDGYGKGGGITPTGTKNIIANGTYDVTEYASAVVAVPASGATPSGTKEITQNGTFDVTNFASALVNVTGLNARIFTSTVSADATSGSPQIAPANDYIASLIAKDNAFVCVRHLGVKASTAMLTFWFNAKFPIAYAGSTKYNAVLVRQSASAHGATFNVNGITGENYSGHLCVASNGKLYCYPSTAYPLKAGTYQIIAGTLEML